MNDRLRYIIDVKFGGRQTAFAAEMGWTPQFVSKMVTGTAGIGLKPILAILQKFPNLDARWLLLGEGLPFTSGVDVAKRHLYKVLSLEKYMPVMTPEQMRLFCEEGFTDFPPSVLEHWQSMLDQ